MDKTDVEILKVLKELYSDRPLPLVEIHNSGRNMPNNLKFKLEVKRI